MSTITIASYNIQHGVDCRFDWNALAEAPLAVKADVIGLQEVDMFTARSAYVNTLKEMSSACHLPYSYFARAMDYNHGEYGSAQLSAFPILRAEKIKLEAGNLEPRRCGHLIVDVDGQKVHVFNTHLTYEDEALRNHQIREIAGFLPKNEPFVLTGDFNTDVFSDFDPIVRAFDGKCALVNCAAHPFLTCHEEPPVAIDNILYPTDFFRLLDCGMIENNHSDHNLLYAKLELL